MNQYYDRIASVVFDSLENEFADNFDFEISKIDNKIKYKNILEIFFNKYLRKINKNLFLNIFHKNFYWNNIHEYKYLYDSLCDERSKKILIEILAYKILGFQKIKLSLNNEYYWKIIDHAKYLKCNEKLHLTRSNKILDLFDLNLIGFDIKIFYLLKGIVNTFILEQYNYNDIVKVDFGDTVIDAGGCWGDTALYFAEQGAKKVYTFEFIASNLRVMHKNLLLNRSHKDIIKIIDNAVYDTSGYKMSYIDKGPSSRLATDEKYNNSVLTLSIDDCVEKFSIENIDFIKMDIEGAEFKALKGAEKTIKRFKPKLAISAYHQTDDLYRLPKIIHDFREDYDLFLDYYTIIGDEIILYGI